MSLEYNSMVWSMYFPLQILDTSAVKISKYDVTPTHDTFLG